MTTESDTEYIESSNSMNEIILENVKQCREDVINRHMDYLRRSEECETKDYEKYSILANIKEREIFEDDSEDLGIKEDFNILGIQ